MENFKESISKEKVQDSQEELITPRPGELDPPDPVEKPQVENLLEKGTTK